MRHTEFSSPNHQLTLFTILAFLALVAWDASGLDLMLAQLAGNTQGFPLRHHWLFTHVLHDGLRRAAWVLALGLCLAVWWPVEPLMGSLARLDTAQRLQFAITTLAAAFAISVIKSFSTTSCPWDLHEFGGLARYASHWTLFADGGTGRCFPAGHASSGFAFLGGYFAFRRSAPRVALTWLLAAAAVGLTLGIAQQLRGAHFMSHTLWTGWICWCVAFGLDTVWPHSARAELSA